MQGVFYYYICIIDDFFYCCNGLDVLLSLVVMKLAALRSSSVKNALLCWPLLANILITAVLAACMLGCLIAANVFVNGSWLAHCGMPSSCLVFISVSLNMALCMQHSLCTSKLACTTTASSTGTPSTISSWRTASSAVITAESSLAVSARYLAANRSTWLSGPMLTTADTFRCLQSLGVYE